MGSLDNWVLVLWPMVYIGTAWSTVKSATSHLSPASLGIKEATVSTYKLFLYCLLLILFKNVPAMQKNDDINWF